MRTPLRVEAANAGVADNAKPATSRSAKSAAGRKNRRIVSVVSRPAAAEPLCAVPGFAGIYATSLFERGRIAEVETRFLRLEEPAHDLAAPRLGKLGHELELGGGSEGTEALAHVFHERRAQVIARLVSNAQDDEGLDRFALHLIRLADDSGLTAR